jgi:hypothetical protein
MTQQYQSSLVPIRFLEGDQVILATGLENKMFPEYPAASDPAYVAHIQCGGNEVQHVLTISSNAVLGGKLSYVCSHPRCITNKPGYVGLVNTP